MGMGSVSGVGDMATVLTITRSEHESSDQKEACCHSNEPPSYASLTHLGPPSYHNVVMEYGDEKENTSISS